jgi:hypothetical protein
MPEKKDSYEPGNPGGPQSGGQKPPSQESIDLLTRLLQEFGRRPTSGLASLAPEVERDIADVAAVLESIEDGLALRNSPIRISGVTPNGGSASGGERVRITGSHLLQGATVRFGNNAAKDVSVASLTEIDATTPPGSAGAVDVVVNTLAGSASLARGYTYRS